MRIHPALLLTLLLPACDPDLDFDINVCGHFDCTRLDFTGATFGDGYGYGGGNLELPTTALGGVQTIELIDRETDGALGIRYSAITTSDDLAVIDQEENRVQVRADTGGATLQIFNVSGVKLDFADVSVISIDRMGLVPEERQVRSDPSVPWEVWTGAIVNGVVTLETEWGTRLVDESMDIRRVRDGVQVVTTEWDSFQLIVPETGADLTVTAGRAGAERRDEVFHLTASQQIDEVLFLRQEWHGWNVSIRSWCFHARHGEADLLHVPWTVTLTGPARLLEYSDADNCILAERIGDGLAELTVSAPGIEPASVDIDSMFDPTR